jgi:hypothetical protein
MLYASPDIIQVTKPIRLRYAGHVARMVETRDPYMVLVGKPEGRRPLGRPRRREEVGKGEGQRNGLIWLRTATGGGTFGFHKMRGIS